MATYGMDPNISQGISQLGGAMLKLPSIQQEAARQAALQANADRLYQLQYDKHNAQLPLIQAQTDWYNARTKNETSKGIAGDLFPSITNNIFETIPATPGSPAEPAGWAPPSSGWSAPDQPMTSIGAYPGKAAVAAQPARTAITSDASKLASFIAGANAAGYNPQTNVNAVRQLLGTQAMTAGTPGNPNVPFQGYQGLGMNLVTPGSFDTNTATGVEDRDAMIANAHANAMELARTKGELANAGSFANQGLRNQGAMDRLVAKGEQVTPGKGPKISFSEDKAAQEKALVLMNEFVNNAVTGASDSDATRLKNEYMGGERGKVVMQELSKVIREKFAATKNVVEAEDAGKAYLAGLKNEDIGKVSTYWGMGDDKVYTANRDVSAVKTDTPKVSSTGSSQTPAEAILGGTPAAPVANPVATPAVKTPVETATEAAAPIAPAPTQQKSEEKPVESPAAAVAPNAAKTEEPAMKQAEPAAQPVEEKPAEVPAAKKEETPASAVVEPPKTEETKQANLGGLVDNNPFKGSGTIEQELPEQIGSPSGAGATSTERTPFEKQYVALMTRKAQLSRSMFRGPVNMSLTDGIGQDERGVLIDLTKMESPTSTKFATIGGKDAVTKELLEIDAKLKHMMRNPIARISPSAAYLDDLTVHGAGRYYVEDASKVDADKRPFVIDKKELMFLLQSPTVIRNSDGSPKGVYKTADGRYIDDGIVFANFDKHHAKLASYFIQEGMFDMKPGDSLARKLFQLKVTADAEILSYNRARGEGSWLKQMGQGLGLPGVQSLMPNGTGFGQGRNMMRYGSPEYLKQHPLPTVPGQ